jgi:hypothetical protein
LDTDKPRRGRPPSGRGRLPLQVTLRGRDEWGEWLASRAQASGISVAELFDLALKCLARSKKLGPVPRRTDEAEPKG